MTVAVRILKATRFTQIGNPNMTARIAFLLLLVACRSSAEKAEMEALKAELQSMNQKLATQNEVLASNGLEPVTTTAPTSTAALDTRIQVEYAANMQDIDKRIKALEDGLWRRKRQILPKQCNGQRLGRRNRPRALDLLATRVEQLSESARQEAIGSLPSDGWDEDMGGPGNEFAAHKTAADIPPEAGRGGPVAEAGKAVGKAAAKVAEGVTVAAKVAAACRQQRIRSTATV